MLDERLPLEDLQVEGDEEELLRGPGLGQGQLAERLGRSKGLIDLNRKKYGLISLTTFEVQ